MIFFWRGYTKSRKTIFLCFEHQQGKLHSDVLRPIESSNREKRTPVIFHPSLRPQQTGQQKATTPSSFAVTHTHSTTGRANIYILLRSASHRESRIVYRVCRFPGSRDSGSPSVSTLRENDPSRQPYFALDLGIPQPACVSTLSEELRQLSHIVHLVHLARLEEATVSSARPVPPVYRSSFIILG